MCASPYRLSLTASARLHVKTSIWHFVTSCNSVSMMRAFSWSVIVFFPFIYKYLRATIAHIIQAANIQLAQDRMLIAVSSKIIVLFTFFRFACLYRLTRIHRRRPSRHTRTVRRRARTDSMHFQTCGYPEGSSNALPRRWKRPVPISLLLWLALSLSFVFLAFLCYSHNHNISHSR